MFYDPIHIHRCNELQNTNYFNPVLFLCRETNQTNFLLDLRDAQGQIVTRAVNQGRNIPSQKSFRHVHFDNHVKWLFYR